MSDNFIDVSGDQALKHVDSKLRPLGIEMPQHCDSKMKVTEVTAAMKTSGEEKDYQKPKYIGDRDGESDSKMR